MGIFPFRCTCLGVPLAAAPALQWEVAPPPHVKHDAVAVLVRNDDRGRGQPEIVIVQRSQSSHQLKKRAPYRPEARTSKLVFYNVDCTAPPTP